MAPRSRIQSSHCPTSGQLLRGATPYRHRGRDPGGPTTGVEGSARPRRINLRRGLTFVCGALEERRAPIGPALILRPRLRAPGLTGQFRQLRSRVLHQPSEPRQDDSKEGLPASRLPCRVCLALSWGAKDTCDHVVVASETSHAIGELNLVEAAVASRPPPLIEPVHREVRLAVRRRAPPCRVTRARSTPRRRSNTATPPVLIVGFRAERRATRCG